MRTNRRIAWVATAAAMLWGCAHETKGSPPMTEAYRIGQEDVLDVSVWRDGDFSRTLPVRPDGFISMPMVGEVKAEGHTAVELAEIIQKKLEPYVQQPKVTVIVREINSSRVFVTGEVLRPGTYPLRARTSLLQALALAGGFSPFAKENSIKVIRAGQKPEAIPVRYSDLVRDGEKRVDFYLMPGDTVVVP